MRASLPRPRILRGNDHGISDRGQHRADEIPVISPLFRPSGRDNAEQLPFAFDLSGRLCCLHLTDPPSTVVSLSCVPVYRFVDSCGA